MRERKTIHTASATFEVEEGRQPVVNISSVQAGEALHPIEADYHAWLLHQASLLRSQQPTSLDWSNLAEELEAMAARDRRTLRNQLQRLLTHLLKYRSQPEAVEHHKSWRQTIRNARHEIADLVKDSPGIWQGKQDEMLAEAYQRARDDASDETGLPLSDFPKECPWTLDQVLSDESLVPA